MQYFTYTPNKDAFLVLEPGDWTEDEWKTILKAFGCVEAERIVLRDYKMQAYGTPKTGLWRNMLPDKCDFCVFDCAKGRENCKTCVNHDNFVVKSRMVDRQAHEWNLYRKHVEGV